MFSGNNLVDPPKLPDRTVIKLIRYQNHPNNSNRHHVTLTDHIQDYFDVINPQIQVQVEPDEKMEEASSTN